MEPILSVAQSKPLDSPSTQLIHYLLSSKPTRCNTKMWPLQVHLTPPHAPTLLNTIYSPCLYFTNNPPKQSHGICSYPLESILRTTPVESVGMQVSAQSLKKSSFSSINTKPFNDCLSPTCPPVTQLTSFHFILHASLWAFCLLFWLPCCSPEHPPHPCPHFTLSFGHYRISSIKNSALGNKELDQYLLKELNIINVLTFLSIDL